ncbi:AEC family transporter [Desulfogranum mediterraneum]|uniref:AEC family transporter n=1 Tax=Desulfogranum mediterraneum TaxID=160661 RepID=UPI00040F877A|nr:AEC family transporter [Desulfogranum mediterraneum]
MENFVLTLTMLLIGMGLKRLPLFPEESGNVLNLFVIYISLPALILLKIPELLFSRSLLALAVVPWAMLLLSAALILLLARLLRWDRSTTGCLLLLIPLGNTSFLGIPMVQAFFGDHAIPYALLYDQLGSFLALATYGSLVLAFYGSGETQPSVTGVIKKVCTFPPFIALILASLLRPFPLPAMALSLLETLAATLIPLVLIAVGFQLTPRLNRTLIGQLSIGLCIKLVLAPLVALGFCKGLGLEGEVVQVAVFEAGMPPMVSAGALAILAGLSPALTAALVGIGILLSFATLPLLYQLLI